MTRLEELMTHYQLPDLPYDYNALEPVISAQIMEIHHGKHHKAYVANLNQAMESYLEAQQKGDLPKMKVLQKAVNFNAGGHLNHTFFWESLAPQSKGGGGMPSGELLKGIEAEFGKFDAFVEKMSALSIGVQGSGWGWLGLNREKNRVVITTAANQDFIEEQGLIPLLCIDVWEHAYYLQYQNVRADFVKKIWGIVNWKKVSDRYAKAIK